ncbi:hypothetical protein GCM10011506_17310 [Marivirga lumbricoides]|uniref:Uncharacterized protein n=1 Tax=Marivirga lumbricoides TaxID=1046115 RepID=A0ABQ1M6K9_9BACT|nr:hypothetical protein GCM10011506_17310 [Marivirga lumbricoides]
MDNFNVILVTLLALANLLWIWLKLDLNKKGYEVSFFWGHLKDLQNAVSVIKLADNPGTRIKYRGVLISIIVAIILIFILFFSTSEFSSFESHSCKRYNDYLSYGVNGVIATKYIDKENHAYKTLNLTNGQVENEVTYFVDGLYQFVNPSDSINKIPGSSEILVYRNGEVTTFDVDRINFCKE